MRLRFAQVTVDEARQALRGLERGYFVSTRNDAALPVGQVRELLATMRRTDALEASLESTQVTVRLQRSRPA